MPDFSDFIIFADESGDHGLDGIDADFPMFCLSFCLVSKRDYSANIVPAVQQLKFDFWGHDSVVLHEHEIRKTKGAFGLLRTDRMMREDFFNRLNELMVNAPMTIFASVIKKHELVQRYATPWNPYEIALLFCMEKVLAYLLRRGEQGREVHVLFESRGKKEDAELEIEFRRICDNRRNWGYRRPDFSQMRFEPVFVSKAANSVGLQLADLTARPIALNFLRPEQQNRAYEIIQPKLGGIKCFP